MKKIMLIALIGVIGSSLLVGCGNEKANASANNQNSTQVEQSNKTENTEAKDGVYKAGLYEVGKDLPAGEYVVMRTSLDKNAKTTVLVSKDSKQSDVTYEDTELGYVYVTLNNGEFINVQNGQLFLTSKAKENKPEDKVYKDGMYKVGKDINPGTYEVKSLGSDASVEVAKDSKHTKDSVILNKKIDKTEKIILKENEYVTLKNSEITVK